MDYFKLMADNGFYTKPERLKCYLEKQLFKNIDLKDKSIIDIGGGNGLFGFYAAINGASRVVVMEPEFDGSSQGMIAGFNKINNLLGNPVNISHTNKVLEDYDRVNNKFDIILMHNSVNHIDEQSCIRLKEDKKAQLVYFQFFEKLQQISKPGGILIICDCARNNVFGDLKLPNPLSPSIEWEKHQNPTFWAELLERNNFKKQSIQWTYPNFLGEIGNLLFRNKLMAYLTISHFRLVLKNLNKE
jgi:SAM-dependent methyltransferase